MYGSSCVVFSFTTPESTWRNSNHDSLSCDILNPGQVEHGTLTFSHIGKETGVLTDKLHLLRSWKRKLGKCLVRRQYLIDVLFP
jgi:hypothetical protein